MKLDFLMLADRAYMDEKTGKLEISGGGVTHITVPSFPFELTEISVVLRFFLDRADVNVSRNIRVQLVDPNGLGMLDVSGELTPGRNVQIREGHEGEDIVFVVVGRLAALRFEEPGQYQFVATLDGELVDERRVVVVPASPQDTPQPSGQS